MIDMKTLGRTDYGQLMMYLIPVIDGELMVDWSFMFG